MNSFISLETQLSISVNLLLVMVLSGLIGLNREQSSRAGLRTHILAGIGACLFTLMSIYAFPEGDPTRIASNVVTGIGFLGGGIIIQRKDKIYDVTTAAGIWATAAVGMAVGVGAWFVAIFTTVVIWFTLNILKKLKKTAGLHDEAATPEQD